MGGLSTHKEALNKMTISKPLKRHTKSNYFRIRTL